MNQTLRQPKQRERKGEAAHLHVVVHELAVAKGRVKLLAADRNY